MIGEEKNGIVKYERKAGGAPFNVACGLKQFGAQVQFAGSVGQDLIGDFLLDFAKNRGFDEKYIKKCQDKNTTLAFVELNSVGERSFCFYRKNTADYDMPEILDEDLVLADIVLLGSLMLSSSKCVEYALDIARRSKEKGKKVAFDVNFRTDIFPNKESAVEIYKKILSQADIVKFSEDEVEIFGEEFINTQLANKLVLISLGARGSEWRYKGEKAQVDTISVKPIDTTGAGDAFFAGTLANLDGVKEWDSKSLNKALRFGNIAGALNTLGKGAIDNLPTIEKIKSLI